MNFLTKLNKVTNQTTTENGAPTLRSTNNPLVDFFALAGATRETPELGLDLFKKSLAFDKLSTIRILFYLRDIREGQGERQLFKNCIKYLEESDETTCKKVIQHIPEFGRWDDIFALKIENILPIIQARLKLDYVSDQPSLLAKWMPSENTSSAKTRTLATQIRKALDATSREYRKMLSTLRARISLIEQKMSKKEWETVEYDKIPSQASLKYRKAFVRNDNENYTKFLEQVKSGEKKINTGTLYPHQIYNIAKEVGADELWNNLPDYTQGKNAIVVADNSGSMYGTPITVSTSLAIYFAERNKGMFKDHFITFSANPTLQKIVGTTLREKIDSLEKAEWGYNTNLFKVFECILKSGATQEEMPETIYIISDMEFDEAVDDKTNFEAIDELYKSKGIVRPNLVFWNVNARNKQVPVEYKQGGVALVSGLSPTVFKIAVENLSPIEIVENIAKSERYAIIEI